MTPTTDRTQDATHVVDVRRAIGASWQQGYLLALIGTVAVSALVADDWRTILTAAPSVALAAVALLASRGPAASPRLLVVAAVVGVATFAWSAVVGGTPAAGIGIGACAGVAIMRTRRRRPLVAVAAILLIGGITALGALRDDPNAVGGALLLGGMAGVWAVTVADAERQRGLIDLLEGAKDAERELSLLRERARFAADLHDVQGHSLHAIRLKAAVATRMQGRDDARVAEELEAIAALAGDAIEQGRALATATHELSFATELANAQQLLEAAGVVVRLDGDGAPGPHDATLALVLREATTNVLRHARPSTVRIAVDAASLRVANDGAGGARRPLRGLATLRHRVADAGGRLDVEHVGDEFALRLAFEGRA